MAKGIYVSPGRYRDPSTGKVYNSTTGNLPSSSSGSSSRGRTPAAPPNPFFQNPNSAVNSAFGNAGNSIGSTLQGQLRANQYTAQQNSQLNRPNIETSSGAESWVQQPDGSFTRRYTENDNLKNLRTGAEQGDLQTQGTFNQLGGQAASNFGQSYSLGGAPKVSGEGDRIGERQRVENSLIQRFDEVNQPQFQRQRQTMLQELADQGITPGSAQYTRRLADLDSQQQNTRRDYTTSALQFGGAEMERTNNLQTGDYNRFVDQYDRQRYAPVNEMSQLGQANSFRPRPSEYQFSPMAAVDFGNIDVGGTVGMFKQNEIARMNAGRSGGGGGGSQPNYFNEIVGISGPSGGGGSSGSSGIIGAIGSGIGAGLQSAAMQPRALTAKKNTNAFFQ
jgi:hypothetical protein